MMVNPGSVSRSIWGALDRLPYWLLALVLLGLWFLWLILSDGDYHQILGALIRGVGVSLYVTFWAFGLALGVGLIAALGLGAAARFIREIARFYVELVRGIPVLVLLFYIAFVGAPQYVVFHNWLLFPLIDREWIGALSVRDIDFTWRAIIALTISYSAFLAEVFRAGIDAVPKGQWEAGRTIGLSRWQTLRMVILPQAIRMVLPPLGNDFIAMLKDSALVSALGVQDITQLGKVMAASTFQFFETYNVVAFLYLTLTISLSVLVRWVERVLNRAPEN
jgi:polar amino acid transport system permease protein